MKNKVKLIDDTGAIWCESDLSPTRVKAIVRAYELSGVSLMVVNA